MGDQATCGTLLRPNREAQLHFRPAGRTDSQRALFGRQLQVPMTVVLTRGTVASLAGEGGSGDGCGLRRCVISSCWAASRDSTSFLNSVSSSMIASRSVTRSSGVKVQHAVLEVLVAELVGAPSQVAHDTAEKVDPVGHRGETDSCGHSSPLRPPAPRHQVTWIVRSSVGRDGGASAGGHCQAARAVSSRWTVALEAGSGRRRS